MFRKLLSYAILGLIGFWLVFSYLPKASAFLPMIDTQTPAVGLLFGALLIVSLSLFLLLQVWLLWSTAQLFCAPNLSAKSTPQLFGLRLSVELFLTTLPLLMTLGLAMIGFQAWSGLSGQ